jgi:uncharacterized membrane protein YfcA
VLDFLAFAAVGLLAQLIDGALGMGYGVISSVMLLTTGVPPAQTSASVHAAKLFTTATSGTSHFLHGNVDRKLMIQLATAGVLGGVLGATLLTQIPGATMRPLVFMYLLIVGIIILVRCFRPPVESPPHSGLVSPLGAVGGFLDAIGGGGWGPVVTSTLIGAGAPPRYVIGSVNAAEFVVTCAVVSVFVTTLLFGIWHESEGLLEHTIPVVGLIAGGIPAAILAGKLLKRAPRKPLTLAVSALIILLSSFELAQWLGVIAS